MPNENYKWTKGKNIKNVLKDFFMKYPEIRATEKESRRSDEYRTNIYLLGTSTGKVLFALKDKVDDDGKFKILTDDPGDMMFLCSLIKKGMTFKDLLQSKMAVPKENEK